MATIDTCSRSAGALPLRQNRAIRARAGNLLACAATWHLVVGALIGIAPISTLSWLGVPLSSTQAALGQCFGMITVAFGVGFAIASRAPDRHWPVVLMGLLAKVLVPAVVAYNLLVGSLPTMGGAILLISDVFWWLPFGIVLWHAARVHQSRVERVVLPPTEGPADPPGQMLSQFGSSLDELSRRGPVLVVLLRHSGCTFCRESLADIAESRSAVEALGTTVALVHMGQREPEELLSKYELSDLHCFRDPMCHLYEHFGLPMGSFRQLFGLRVLWRGIRAAAGHGIGGPDGNVFRMPGAVLLHRGQAVRTYHHSSAADRPDYVRLAAVPSDA